MKQSSKVLFVFVVVLLVLSACGPAVAAAPTEPPNLPAPTATSLPPTATAVPLYQQVTLTSSDNTETGQKPDYTITAQTPLLTGSDDARVTAFNDAAATIVKQAVDDFKSTMTNLQPLPDIGASSMLTLKYELVSPPGNILSLKLTWEGYVEGMAHPYHVTRTLNFDLEKGQEVQLDALFLPNSDYLKTIADFCAAELQKRDIGFGDIFAQGAAPTAENYQDWNLTPQGLEITFNEYQVAPYAAGPQTVDVPYSELAKAAASQGPLAGFLPK